MKLVKKYFFCVRLITIVLVGILALIGCGGKKKKAALWPLALSGGTSSGGDGAGASTVNAGGGNGGPGSGNTTGGANGGTGTNASPVSLAYVGSPFSSTRTIAITTLTPTLEPSGVTLTSCTATPPLPTGLNM